MLEIWSVVVLRSFFIAVIKLPTLAKLAVVMTALLGTAVAIDLPIHDIWFDYVLFIFASAIVGGMPEPDTDLPRARFAYTWLYRTGHLLVASATAYFMHKNRWAEISGEPPTK